MTTIADKATLFAQRFTTEDVEIPGVGTVRVRCLSREEVLVIRGVELPYAEMERKLLAAAMIEPTITEEEALQWQRASPAGELEPITKVIMRLSGLEADAAKAAVKRFRG